MPASRWARWSAGNAVLRLADACLRGAGQVMFQDHPLSGLCFLAAVACAAWGAGPPALLPGALLGLVVSTLTAKGLRADPDALRQGLYGFNGMLVGLALPSFVAASPAMWLLLVLGAAASSVAMLALGRALRRSGVPVLTAPFLLTTWVLLLIAMAWSLPGVEATSAAEGALVAPQGGAWVAMPLLRGWIVALAQVFLLDDLGSALLVLLGLFVASRSAAAWALIGSALALGVAVALGLPALAVSQGLYGFSPVLTAVALGSAFASSRPWAGAATALAIVLTTLAQVALNAGLGALRLPALTAPFVLVTWLFLLMRRRPGTGR